MPIKNSFKIFKNFQFMRVFCIFQNLNVIILTRQKDEVTIKLDWKVEKDFFFQYFENVFHSTRKSQLSTWQRQQTVATTIPLEMIESIRRRNSTVDKSIGSKRKRKFPISRRPKSIRTKTMIRTIRTNCFPIRARVAINCVTLSTIWTLRPFWLSMETILNRNQFYRSG